MLGGPRRQVQFVFNTTSDTLTWTRVLWSIAQILNVSASTIPRRKAEAIVGSGLELIHPPPPRCPRILTVHKGFHTLISRVHSTYVSDSMPPSFKSYNVNFSFGIGCSYKRIFHRKLPTLLSEVLMWHPRTNFLGASPDGRTTKTGHFFNLPTWTINWQISSIEPFLIRSKLESGENCGGHKSAIPGLPNQDKPKRTRKRREQYTRGFRTQSHVGCPNSGVHSAANSIAVGKAMRGESERLIPERWIVAAVWPRAGIDDPDTAPLRGGVFKPVNIFRLGV
ncbi:hypothetical protein C8R46DRAFT_1027624 [Mycena filopes]|nr:hypothetical protein C8R46DRAFT_1027624 [Mycena filopes]